MIVLAQTCIPQLYYWVSTQGGYLSNRARDREPVLGNTETLSEQDTRPSLKRSRPRKEKAHLFVKFSPCIGKSRSADTFEGCLSISSSQFRDTPILRTHVLSFRARGLFARYLGPHCLFKFYSLVSVSFVTLTDNALQLVHLDEIPTAREFFCCLPCYFQSNLSARPGHLLANSIYSWW